VSKVYILIHYILIGEKMACTEVEEKKQNGMDGGEKLEKATPLSCEGIYN
jgi:hypothetical protein